MIASPPERISSPPAPAARSPRLLRRLQMKGVALRKLHDRERRRLREELGRVPGLMTLLMKTRNGRPWTSAERDALREQLRSMRRLWLYIGTILVPGTAITLPLLAWWLDRRHARRLPSVAEPPPGSTGEAQRNPSK
jgi:hypothetical protein